MHGFRAASRASRWTSRNYELKDLDRLAISGEQPAGLNDYYNDMVDNKVILEIMVLKILINKANLT